MEGRTGCVWDLVVGGSGIPLIQGEGFVTVHMPACTQSLRHLMLPACMTLRISPAGAPCQETIH